MSPNTFGRLFCVTTFGESHGPAIGAVIDGCPAGVIFSQEILQDFLDRRRPGASVLTSARNEADDCQILSGVFENKTLGTPIACVVFNEDSQSRDYQFIAQGEFRRGHAEDMWKEKFGHFDYRGGGRSSGRETLCRIMGGAVAKMFVMQEFDSAVVTSLILNVGPLSSATASFSADLEKLLLDAKAHGKSYGGRAKIRIQNLPAGLGEPVFSKLKSELAKAMLSVGSVVGFELGEGFASAIAEGSEFHSRKQNPYGGIRGGISTGEDIEFTVAVKPTSSVLDVAKKGRHDPCILLRALVVFEAMTWLVLADQLLARRLNRV